jgi:Putative prokaryotic signal transducing protein
MDPVTLTVVRNELEAEELCGLLRVNGIECMFRGTDISAGSGIGGGYELAGPTEILVNPEDLAAARALLPPGS